MNKKKYYATRKTAYCKPGEIYENEGGGKFICLSRSHVRNSCTFENVVSRWRLIAYGVGVYEDGKINWDYSEGLGFAEEFESARYDTVLRG